MSESFLYFTQGVDRQGAFFHVGFSATDVNLRKRLKHHVNIRHEELLALIHGTEDNERSLHKFWYRASQAALYAGSSEYFKKDEAMLEFVESILVSGYACASLDEIDILPDVPFAQWDPARGMPAKSAVLPDGSYSLFQVLPAEDRIRLISTDEDARKQYLERHHDDYITPKEYALLVRSAFGRAPELDPASSAVANRMVGAKNFYTPQVNGLDLKNPWYGPLFLNPPATNRKLFITRLANELTSGAVTEAIVVLGDKDQSARYVQDNLKDHVTAIYTTLGRPAFDHMVKTTDDHRSESPTNGRMFLYAGSNVDRFVEAFAEDVPLGWFLIPRIPPTKRVRSAPRIVIGTVVSQEDTADAL